MSKSNKQKSNGRGLLWIAVFLIATAVTVVTALRGLEYVPLVSGGIAALAIAAFYNDFFNSDPGDEYGGD